MSEGRSLLRSPVQYLKGVGSRRAECFRRLEVRTGEDLLYHLPHRYEDATTISPIASLKPGTEATVVGRVVSQGVLETRGGFRIFRAVLQDASGMVEAAWPGRPWMERVLSRGDLVLASGPVRFYHGRQLQPREQVVLEGADEEEGDGAGRGATPGGSAAGRGMEGRVFPVYPATEGLGHRQIRAIVRRNLPALLEEVASREVLPEPWRKELGLPRLERALEALHRPRDPDEIEPARRRLAYEELFLLQLLHARTRSRRRREVPGVAFDAPPGLSDAFLEALPFRLTEAQERAWREIREDLENPSRMYRLLQGDVGSGKTVVAAAAMLRAAESGWQAALMAPTELLAEQHRRTLERLLETVGVRPVLLTGSVTGSRRRRTLEALRQGRALVVVGTHALIQEGVEFGRLGLVVVDEQHRFGVEQRRRLRDAGAASDVLVMSATPIPRSLALSLYGQLDLSVIDRLPPGRSRVVTGVRGPESREAALEFLRSRLRQGEQGYVVVPLVEDSEAVDARSAVEVHAELVERFEEFRVGLLHGQLPTEEKEEVMRAFLEGDLHLLVATTVIEVGIDVPRATVMLIEDAQRFGLAQLHQLRGRVGRGDQRGYCVALHDGSGVSERLAAFARTTDGFELARADLRIRGQGDLFGRAQHGVPELRFARLEEDADLLEDARQRARRIVEMDPDLRSPGHRAMARRLAERYGDGEALYEVG